MAHPLFDVYFAPSSDDRSGNAGRGDRRGDRGNPRERRDTHDAASGGTRQDAPDAARVSPEEVQLVQRLRAGDETAFDACVRRYGDPVVRVAQVVTGSRDTAWDVAQEVLLELWRGRERLDPTRNLGGYLYRAARHRALDFVRREHAHTRAAHAAYPDDTDVVERNLGDVAVDAADFRARVHAVLDALPPRCREIFLLHREAGLDYAELEMTLGLSNATIRNQVSRATRHLARALAAGLFDDWMG